MYVYAQRFAAYLLGMYAGREGKPVVCVNDVKLFRPCHHTGNDRVVVYLVMQVGRITTCKIHASQVVDMHVVEVGIDMVTIAEIIVGVHDVSHPLLHIVVVDIAPGYRHTVHGHYLGGTAVFVAEGMRQTERDVYIALCVKSLRDAEIGGSKTTEYVRRILPSKH